MTTMYLITFIVNGTVYTTLWSEKVKFPEMEAVGAGSNFTGWYYDEDYTKPVKEGDTLTGDTTIYSKWTSYIKNKLNGTYIHMLDAFEDTSSQWYYAKSEQDIQNDPLYKVVNIGGGNWIESYPTWVKLGNYSSGDVLYTYEGSTPIKNIEIVSWTRKDGVTDYTSYQIVANEKGQIISLVSSPYGSIYTAKAKIEVTFEDGTTDTDEFYVYIHNACFAR